MLRMPNVIYERGSAARQTAAGASPGAGPGRRALLGHMLCEMGNLSVDETLEVSLKHHCLTSVRGLQPCGRTLSSHWGQNRLPHLTGV